MAPQGYSARATWPRSRHEGSVVAEAGLHLILLVDVRTLGPGEVADLRERPVPVVVGVGPAHGVADGVPGQRFARRVAALELHAWQEDQRIGKVGMEQREAIHVEL